MRKVQSQSIDKEILLLYLGYMCTREYEVYRDIREYLIGKSWSRQYRKGYIRRIAEALIYREELIRGESLHREYHVASPPEVWGDDRIYLGERRCRDTDDDIVCITPERAKI